MKIVISKKYTRNTLISEYYKIFYFQIEQFNVGNMKRKQNVLSDRVSTRVIEVVLDSGQPDENYGK